ncbi:MAG TPA: MFS transporter, partial [Pelolinea sp.]|nr:MFS transporter [Pelolinea sp.]
MKKLSLDKLLAINIYWVGLSFMWNSLHPIILPAVLIYLVPESMKNSYLGVLTFAGLILAMVIQPISGAASDNWRSRWGRRRPLALIGTLLDFIFLALLAWSGNIFVVIIGYIGLQTASNIAHGPMQGLIPDMVPDEQMGAASGLKNLMDMGGLIIASLAAGNLLSPNDRYPTTIMLVVMAVLAVSSAVTFLTTREKPTSEERKNHNQLSLKEIFRVDFSGNRNYFRLIASRFIFLIGIYGVQTFAQYYIRDVMQAPNPVKATGDLMAALALSLVACSLIGGWLTDRIGARKVVAMASVIAAAGSFLLILAKDLTAMTLYASVLGAGIGFYLTSNWAFASKLAPKEESGKFLGLTNLATAGASALSKLGGIPIDIANNAFPGRFLGYSGLFFLGG